MLYCNRIRYLSLGSEPSDEYSIFNIQYSYPYPIPIRENSSPLYVIQYLTFDDGWYYCSGDNFIFDKIRYTSDDVLKYP